MIVVPLCTPAPQAWDNLAPLTPPAAASFAIAVSLEPSPQDIEYATVAPPVFVVLLSKYLVSPSNTYKLFPVKALPPELAVYNSKLTTGVAV